MASMGGYVGSPLRPRFHSAKKFLSLQLSQTSQAISAEFNNMLRNQTLAKKRKKVINEIFATERSYQDHLAAVTSQFLGPLRVACILPENVLNTIFSNVEALQAVNRELLSHMETLGVGDAFLAMAPFIKLYSTYANNFAQAQVVLEEWEKKSTEFATFKKAQEMREECRGLNLGALLITPVQRVPRYKLLLESLLNKTPKDHPDFEKLQEATVEINKVAHHINENIRQHENFQKMLSIQNSLTGEGAPRILAPGRLFIKEGSLLKVCSRGSQERMFFLFSDILLYAKKCGSIDKEQSLYLCRRVLPLIDCDVEQMFGGSTEGDGCPGALFKLTCKDKSLLLFSKSKMEAINWFKSIRDAISFLRTCRASLRKPKRDDIELPKRSTPLTRLAARRGRGGLSIIRQESSIECHSSPVCLKDSLYPLRKELMAKPSALQSSTKNRARRTFGPRTPGGKKAVTNKPRLETCGTTKPKKQDERRTETANGSQHSARNGSETSSDGERTSKECSITNSSAIITRGSASDDQENNEDSAAGQSGVKTRAQKRRLSFKGNHDIELFSPGTNKRRCFRPKLDVSCVQAAESPLRNALNQVRHTPAKLRTTKYVMKDQDLVESTTCVVM